MCNERVVTYQYKVIIKTRFIEHNHLQFVFYLKKHYSQPKTNVDFLSIFDFIG